MILSCWKGFGFVVAHTCAIN